MSTSRRIGRLGLTLLLLARLAAATSFAPLRFTSAGTFQLSVFEDLHFGEGEDTTWGPSHDNLSVVVLDSILAVETPQLVVLNGDLITGENTHRENASVNFDRIAGPLVAKGVPWASTYGNHDSDFNSSKEEIYIREKRWPNSLTGNMVKGDNPGVSNYYLLVYPHKKDDDDNCPALILWFFDSRGGNYYQKKDADGLPIGMPNWVDSTVVSWFASARANLTKTFGRTIPSLAFVHIPINAFAAFQNKTVDPNREPGFNEDDPLAQQGEACCQGGTKTVWNYTGQDIPFMEALLDTKGLMAVFSGHDHGNDWCSKWDSRLPGMNLTGNGLNLCFGRHTGYGGYGRWTRGSRQIILNQTTLAKALEFDTYIRQEDASISGAIVLNSTYGVDRYPAVPVTNSTQG